jgi:N-acetylglutamate synthase/N-acetylornithine aminotransferase
MLTRAANLKFNRTSADGYPTTNDLVLLASGELERGLGEQC